MIKLSFCIPTYNRCDLLKQTLESILSQKTDSIQIIISDNHSTDETKSYMEELSSKNQQLTYHRFEESVPCGENLLKSISLARGEYCWLMTDDDRVELGGLEHVLMILDNNPHLTGLSVNVEGYDRDLKEKKNIKYSHSLKEFTLFIDSEKTFKSLGPWLGFWSAQIIHREKWAKALEDDRYQFFSGYHHLYLILKMIKEDPIWIFTEKKCVGYRADNESFSQEYGRLSRFSIDIEGYNGIGKALFSSAATDKVNKVVISRLLFWQLVRAKYEGLSFCSLVKMISLSYSRYKRYLVFWFKLFPLLLCPRAALLLIRPIYLMLKKVKN